MSAALQVSMLFRGLLTFHPGNLVPQLAKPSNHGVVLHALPPLPSQSPSIGNSIGRAVDPEIRALTPTSSRARRP